MTTKLTGFVVALFCLSWMGAYTYEVYSKQQQMNKVYLCMRGFTQGILFSEAPVPDYETAEIISESAKIFCEELVGINNKEQE